MCVDSGRGSDRAVDVFLSAVICRGLGACVGIWAKMSGTAGLGQSNLALAFAEAGLIGVAGLGTEEEPRQAQAVELVEAHTLDVAETIAQIVFGAAAGAAGRSTVG